MSTAVAIFLLVTTELMPIGILSSVGAALHVSDGAAGLMVTVPGIVGAFAAPLIAVGIGRLDRRPVLCALIGLMVAANLLSAVASSLTVLLVARVLAGLSIGGFWVIAGSLAVRLVPANFVGRATTLIFGGVSVAAVLGVPAATAIGQHIGWRAEFGCIAIVALVVLAALALLLPPLPASATLTVRQLAQLFREPMVRTGVLATFLLVTGHFAAYTFIGPVLLRIAGIGPAGMSGLLLVFGVVGILGNAVAGSAAAHDVRRTLLVITAMLTASMALLPLLGHQRPMAIVLVACWGLAYGGVSVTVQIWVLRAAPEAVEAAGALFVPVFNLAIALGAMTGGLAMDRLPVSSVLWLGAALVGLAACTAWSAHPSPSS